jgi:hypothetical protein
MKNKEMIFKFDKPQYKTPKTFTRPGSMKVLEAPSRIGKTLYYPDGKIIKELT